MEKPHWSSILAWDFPCFFYHPLVAVAPWWIAPAETRPFFTQSWRTVKVRWMGCLSIGFLLEMDNNNDFKAPKMKIPKARVWEYLKWGSNHHGLPAGLSTTGGYPKNLIFLRTSPHFCAFLVRGRLAKRSSVDTGTSSAGQGESTRRWLMGKYYWWV